MEDVTCKSLKEIKESGEELKPYEANDDQFFDFASAAYLNKNIRVAMRPESGVTRDPTQDGRQSNVSGKGDGEMDDEAR